MTDPLHRHPATVAFDRFREAYPELFCAAPVPGFQVIAYQRMFEEGWLACKIAADNAMNGTI